MTTDFNKQALREEYISRINRVMDYIEQHLGEELSLEQLARVAHFSRFHFHRIFKAMVGETLNHYIQRLRVERAATLLLNNPKRSITDIAFDCGFSGSAPFARAFREFFYMSASEWRRSGQKADSNIRKTFSNERKQPGNIRKDFNGSVSYHFDPEKQTIVWRIKMGVFDDVKVEVKELPELNVAYIRHIGPYAGDSALFEGLFTKLMKWAGPRGLLRFPETKALTVYHDDPNITEEEKLRISVCITVPQDTKPEGEIGTMIIPGGKFAVAHFEILPHQYGDAWEAVMGGWLPESGYQPDDRMCYELNYNDPKEHPEGKHIIDICEPVKPM
jgi:AraC family transcriptional regulator